MRGYYIGLVSFFKTHNGYIKTLDFIYKVLVIFEKLLDVKTARFCGKVVFERTPSLMAYIRKIELFFINN